MPVTDPSAERTAHWDCVSYVIRSQYRRAVVARLDVSPATPSMVRDECPYALSHLSRAIDDLRDAGLVDLLVSEDRRKGRLYGLTESGAAVWATATDHDLAEAHARAGTVRDDREC